MPSDPSNKPLEEPVVQTGGDMGEAATKAAGRRARKAAGAKSARRSTAESSASRLDDDPGERLREHAAEMIAATRERIVEKPLQAVLVAAAAGAFVALLLGAARR